ncbi:RNA polymerase sigma factor [Amycolatopsis methanolica]|uniref:ECF subfamily RNA polymerase sigma-24 subunit n=1 Tax=Amycolatopsis methanolica 239 TaxID=1068978 RepID=A0A076MK95_AMYME|nr:sigma-70 family RNA polymerase sigma factor [Amycolatopsis methanolica]AIJ21288.1 ECF subfamily RNA polymerase sigma-24 subunit [Amycolatopsis methanolica 239]
MPVVEHAAIDTWELVSATQGGDFAAFAGIYRRYARVIADYAYAKTGDHATAEDIASETFLRALRSIGSVRDLGKDLGSWLTTIARNVTFDMAKSGWSRNAAVTAQPPETVAREGIPEEDVLRELDRAALRLAITQLTPDQQECLWWRFFANRSVSETARHIGRNAAAVRALQHRAVRRLGELLPPSLVSPDDSGSAMTGLPPLPKKESRT